MQENLEKIFAVIEAFSLPGAMIVASFALHTLLGPEGFGHFAFPIAFLGLGAFLSIGVPVVLQTELPRLQEAENYRDRAHLISTLASAAILGAILLSGLVAVLIHAFGSLAFPDIINPENRTGLATVLAALLVLQQADLLLGAILKAQHRIRDAATIELVSRTALLAAVLATAYYSNSPLACVGVVCGSLAFSAALKLYCLRNELAGVQILVGVSRDAWRDIWERVRWAWAQGAVASVFSTADRFVVAALLGPAKLGIYVLCVQIAQIILVLPAAALQQMLPRISTLAAGPPAAMVAEIRRARTVNLAGSAIIFVSVSALGAAIFYARLGNDAHIAIVVFLMLTCGFFIASLNVHAHYALLALRRQRTVSLINIFAGVAMLIALVAGATHADIEGAAAGRIIFGIVLLFDIYALNRALR